MFRTLARLLNDPTLSNGAAGYSDRVFLIHPLQLSRWLEQAWTFGRLMKWTSFLHDFPFLGDDRIVQALSLPNEPAHLLNEFLRSGITADSESHPHTFGLANAGTLGETVPLPWDHLIYALLIENTGVYEILAEVVRRYVVGETLESPSIETQQWLRATEELFFRNPPLFHITGIQSEFRPDLRISRRNAYWRMFGMDCAHPLPPQYGTANTDQIWKRDVGVANDRFHEIFVQWLQQVWLGIENVKNSSGANPTDSAYIGQLSQILRDMFDMRRRGGQLAREEFVCVTMMSWFHLTVDSDTPLVRDLKARGTDPADRLAKIAQRVGMKPPRQAREYFEMAEPISTLLRFVELGAFDDASGAELLFKSNSSIRQDMNTIIDLWQSATGDPIKAVAVQVSAQPRASGQPRLLPSASRPAPAPSGAVRTPRTGLVTTNGVK